MTKLLSFVLLAASLNAVDLPPLNDADRWLTQAPHTGKGRPTLLFIFTRDCGNCQNSHTFMNQMHQKYGTKVYIIGIHSPEFAWEKDPAKLKVYAAKQNIRYPIYLDADMKIWNSLGNRYWPAYYLFDKKQKSVATFVGETHLNDRNGQQIESAIQTVLHE